MKYIVQFSIILSLAFIGELLNAFIPLPIPASIYGLVLMLILLQIKVIKLEYIKETAYFLIQIMPLMFIPAGVGLMTSFESLKPILGQVGLLVVITTIIIMVVTGRVTQYLMRQKEMKK